MELNMDSDNVPIEEEIDRHDNELMTAEYQPLVPPELEGWTKSEAYDLCLGLKYYGFSVKGIVKRIPTKTEEQIQAAINYFTAELERKTADQPSPRQKRKMKNQPQVPLAKWADVLTDTYNYEDLRTECAVALRIIADFEKHPHPSVFSNINLRKIYHYIADALEGKPLPDDPVAADIFHECVMDAAAISKALIPINELHDMLGVRRTQNCNIPRKTKDKGLFALRCLISQRNYNPLNVPEHYLKHPPTFTDESLS